MIEIEKILTDVPFLDEIVYYTKILAVGTVLKNKTDADNAETLASAKASGLYLNCMDNVVMFKLFIKTCKFCIDKNDFNIAFILYSCIIQCSIKYSNI